MSLVITEERPDSLDAMQLIAALDEALAPFYPVESRHGFSVEKLLREGVNFFVARREGVAQGCAGLLLVGSDYGEIKRMYVQPQARGLGLGQAMLDHLVAYSQQRGVHVLRLETGIHQTEAIRLYERCGFQRIPPFGPYRADPLSLCYEKRLR